MKFEFMPLDYDYLTIDNKAYVRIFGKTPKGNCCVIDKPINYFYVLSKKVENKEFLKRIKKINNVRKAEIVEKKFKGRHVKAIKIFSDYKDMKEISSKVKKIDEKRKTYERDISLITKYIINKKLKPLIWSEIQGSVLSPQDLNGLPSSLETDFVIKLEKINKTKQKKFKPKVLAFDIEAEEFEIGRGRILMISLVSSNFKKVITWKKCKKPGKNVETLKNEKEMLEKFQEYINKINPDIITGYFSDGFDLPYIRNRARKNNLELRLGQSREKILFSRGRPKKARINGLAHIDLFKFIETVYSQYLKSETLSLNEVASELLNEKKVDFEHHDKKTSEIKEKEWIKFFKYNLQDSVLTFKLFKKLWPDLNELTKIIEEPIYKTSRYTFSRLFENYILHNLGRFNQIAERRPTHEQIQKRRAKRKTEGAFVLQPKAGLYENLSIFDFTSMHTSIIVSFNISRETLTDKKTSYESPEIEFKGEKKKFYFKKKAGFFPQLAKEIMELRKKYKKQYKENPGPITRARSNAFKVLSASIHGYIAFFGARYYSYECSNAILAFVREYNKKTIKWVNKAGFNVIYGDTDSVAFTLDNKTKKQTKNFLKKLNKKLPGIMHLELEGFYKRGIWVTKRSGEFGAKKKYALIDEKNNLKIRGFETVRRDWCKLARKVQNNVLKKILKTGSEKKALRYVRKVVKKIKNREIDRKQLIIRTQLKKPLSSYKASTPHVVIARKMKQKGMPIDPGTLISYYISEISKKKALVRERAKLPDEKGKYDINYYLKKQILPSIENIFQVFEITGEEILHGKKQTKLDGF